MRTHSRVFLLVAAVVAVNCLAAASAFADYVPTERFSGPGSADGQLSVPQRAAVEQSSGDLFVVDRGNDRVQVFSPDGTKAAYSAQFGAAELDGPLGIAIDQTDGSIYVSDADDIVKFDSSYALVGSFASPGVTGALAVDPTTGDLLVADRASDKVLRFNSDGSADGPGFDGSTSGTAFTDPIDIAVNSAGDVYVVDQTEDVDTGTGTSRVERFSGSGAHQASISPFGSSQQAARVAVNPDTDVLAVSGEQYAVNYNGDATVHLFDSANAPINEATTTSQYSKVAGMAFRIGAPDVLFVVTDVSDYPCTCYGTPEIAAFTDVAPPSATIGPVTDVTEFTATFSGEVDPEGSATSYFFEYSSDGGSSWTSTETQELGDTGTDPVPVTFAATGLPDGKALEVRLVATKGGGAIRTESATESFSTLAATDPVASVGPPTDVRTFSATFHGTIDPEGFSTTPIFELSQDGGASWFDAGEGTPSPVTGTDPVDVSLTVNFLSPGTEYQVRLAARDLGGTRHASANAESFTTLELAAPTVTVDPPTNVDSDSAVLTGTVDANEFNSEYRFELSHNAGKTWIFLGSFKQIPPGLGPQHVTEAAEDLDANKTYEVRIVARSQVGETIVSGQAFTTSPSTPGIRPMIAADVRSSRALLRASVNGFGEATSYYFEWGATAVYGSTVPVGDPNQLGPHNQYLNVSELIEGLRPGATYHYRLVAENAAGKTFGPDRTFVTKAAGETCPNAEIREQQRVERLPDCRAYEQVSERDKGGYPVAHYVEGFAGGITASASSGDTAVYTSWGAFSGTDHGLQQTYRARRTDDGWVSRSVTPRSVAGLNNIEDSKLWVGTSRDLEIGVLSTEDPLDPTDVNGKTGIDIYSIDGDGSLELASRGNGSERIRPPGEHPYAPAISQVSGDGGHIFFNTAENLVPEDAGRNPGPVKDVYERTAGETRLVNLDSNGALLNPCGSVLAARPGGQSADTGAVSEDGSRVIFITPAGPDREGPACDVVSELYLRIDGEETIQISRSRLDVAAVPDLPAQYLGAAADGSVIYFQAEKLTDDAPSEAAVYRYVTATDELEPISVDPLPGIRPVRVSRDGSSFYFFLPGPSNRAKTLYIYREGQVRLLADAGGESFTDSDFEFSSAWSSVDGRRLAFVTKADLLNDGAGQRERIYLYDWDEDQMRCVSCVEGAPAPPPLRGHGGFVTGGMSDDGNTVAFQTAQRLTPDDSNSNWDVYRWRDGHGTELISGGSGVRESGFVGISSDGGSIFFTSSLSLALSDSDGGEQDLYVARELGGFAARPSVSRCVGAGCQSPPGLGPAIDTLGTSTSTSSQGTLSCSPLREALKQAAKTLRLLRKRGHTKSSDELDRKIKSAKRRVKKLRRATANCEVSR